MYIDSGLVLVTLSYLMDLDRQQASLMGSQAQQVKPGKAASTLLPPRHARLLHSWMSQCTSLHNLIFDLT